MKPRQPMRVPYAAAVYGRPEIQAVLDVLRDPVHIVAGPRVGEFERRVARRFGKAHGVMVNSGSSANLLALAVLNLPPGGEVITPALTFSTTLAPILQLRLKPVLVDVGLGSYVVDVDDVARRITKRTRALMIPSLIGNLPDLAGLKRVARQHRLVLIEDSCDTIGATFAGRPTGSYSDVTTTSFYASHLITAAGGGGMVMFRDPQLARRARVMAYWGRASTLFGAYEKSEEITKRFAGVLAGDPYDAKFIFSELGYNFQPTEAQGAFGLVQLGHLATFAARRARNFRQLLRFFQTYADAFILPRVLPRARPNWLAFPLIVREEAGFTRLALTKYLEEHNIQTRPIFTGSVVHQPAFARALPRHLASRRFPHAEQIMRQGFLLGCHHGLAPRHLAYLFGVVREFFARRGNRRGR